MKERYHEIIKRKFGLIVTPLFENQPCLEQAKPTGEMESSRRLTVDEQKVMQTALRRSSRKVQPIPRTEARENEGDC